MSLNFLFQFENSFLNDCANLTKITRNDSFSAIVSDEHVVYMHACALYYVCNLIDISNFIANWLQGPTEWVP